jgi:N-acetylmuramoyl-L-alanine amidase
MTNSALTPPRRASFPFFSRGDAKSNFSLPALASGLMLLLAFGSIARAENSLICRHPGGTATVTIHSIDGVDYLFLNELVERTGLTIGWDAILNRLTLLRDGQERVVALVDSPLYRVRGSYLYQRYTPEFRQNGLYLPLEVLKGPVGSALDLGFEAPEPTSTPSPAPSLPEPSPTLPPLSIVPPIPTLPVRFDFPEQIVFETPQVEIEPEPQGTPEPETTVVVLDPGPLRRLSPEGDSRGKDLTYELAVLLKRKLEEGMQIKVVLTRDADPESAMMEAEQRAIRANSAGGDLLVSLRTGWSCTDRAEGFSIFYMSEIADGEEPVRFDSQGRPVGDWATEKGQKWATAYMPYVMESIRLGQLVQKHLDREVQSTDRGLRSARLVLLRSVQMPAVWVELGVLSNRNDQFRLENVDFQEQMVTALYRSIQEFLDTRPGAEKPQGYY